MAQACTFCGSEKDGPRIRTAPPFPVGLACKECREGLGDIMKTVPAGMFDKPKNQDDGVAS